MPEENSRMDPKLLQEAYEESKIKLIMAHFAELEGKGFFEENEKLRKDASYHPSEKQSNKFIRRMNYNFVCFRIKSIFKLVKPTRYLKTATFIPIVAVILLASFLSVDAIRTSVLNLFIQVEREYTTIRLGEDLGQTHGYLQMEWGNAYIPQKIPKGYRIVNATNDQNMKSIEYESETQGFILFQQNNENIGIQLDTEDADEVLQVFINGQESFFVNKNNMMKLVWQQHSSLFLIMGSAPDLSKEQLIEMAESIIFVE